MKDNDGERLRSVALQNASSILKARQRAEKRSEEYLKEAQKLSHTGSFGWKPATGEIFWSEETFRIFECDRTTKPTVELVAQRVHPDDEDWARQIVERAVQDATDFDFEHRLLMPNGSIKYVRNVARAVRDESGALEFVGAVMDVTESRRTEQALQQSEGYLAEAQRLTHTGSWAWRVAGRDALHLSEEWYRIYGFDPEKGMRNWQERLQRVHPEDRAMWAATIDQAISQKSDYEVEFRILHPSGTIRYIHTVGHPVKSASGDVVQFVGIATDITERKQAEEALRRSENYIAEAQRLAHTGSWAWNVATRQSVYWSAENYGLFGFDPEAGIPSDDAFYERIHPEDRDRVRKEVFHERPNEGYEFDVEFRVIVPGERLNTFARPGILFATDPARSSNTSVHR